MFLLYLPLSSYSLLLLLLLLFFRQLPRQWQRLRRRRACRSDLGARWPATEPRGREGQPLRSSAKCEGTRARTEVLLLRVVWCCRSMCTYNLYRWLGKECMAIFFSALSSSILISHNLLQIESSHLHAPNSVLLCFKCCCCCCFSFLLPLRQKSELRGNHDDQVRKLKRSLGEAEDTSDKLRSRLKEIEEKTSAAANSEVSRGW